MTAFDSLTFAQELEKVRLPSDQAERLASLIRDQVLASVVTKDDLAHAEERLGGRIDRIEERLGGRIDRIEETLGGRIDRAEERSKAELAQLEHRMTIRLGTMLVIAIGLIVTVQKLL